MKTTLEVYKQGKEWRWRLKRGRKIVADSAESYKRIGGMRRVVGNVLESFMSGNYQVKAPPEWDAAK